MDDTDGRANPIDPGTGGVALSVIIPMYREESRIGATLADLLPSLERGVPGLEGRAELILVDDGSDDNTVSAVSAWLGNRRAGALAGVRLLRHGANRGKGAAVRTGLAGAAGRWRLVMDADNSCRVEEVPKLLARARETGAGLVAGSRRAADSVVTSSRSRRVTGWVFQTALSAMGMRLLNDTQCGFKVYSREAAEVVVRLGREDGWAFDLEHLLLARRAGLGIAEVGVVWDHRDGGKVNSLRDGLVMLRRAAAMRLARPGAQPARAATVVVVEPPVAGLTGRRTPSAPVALATLARAPNRGPSRLGTPPSPQGAGEERDRSP